MSSEKNGYREVIIIKMYVNLLRNIEYQGVFSLPLKTCFFYMLWTRQRSKRVFGLFWPTYWLLLHQIFLGRKKKGHATLASYHSHKHRRFLAEEPYKGNCHGAKIFSCDSQASCNFPNKAMTLKSVSFQSLIDFHRLMKKHIVYMSGCADIKTGWDGHSSVVSKPGFQTEWTK